MLPYQRASFFFVIFFFLETAAIAQIDSVKQRIFLLGDAGALDRSQHHPVIDWLKKNVEWDDEKNIVLFLGDNIYPLGMPYQGESSYDTAKRIIDYEVSLVKGKKARAYFIPGNHDWKNGKIGGWEQVRNQVDYINSLELKNVKAWPKEGCPGPVEIELGDSIVLVLLDSQWWLHLHEKPGTESHCEYKTEDQIVTAVREIAETHKGQLMIVAMHHPMYSGGIHGGYYQWTQYVFPFTELVPWLYIPFPLIYGLGRGYFGNIQDVRHPIYRAMIRQLEEIFRDKENNIQKYNIIHVSGHDHDLQLLVKDSVPYIVSGSAAELTRVKKRRFTIFDTLINGFAMIEVRKSGKVETRFYSKWSTDMNDPIFASELKAIVGKETKADDNDYERVLPDTVTWQANAKLKGSPIKNFLYGKNYRNEWTVPVKVKVLDIKKERGGLTPTRLGGGKQTLSLTLHDSTNREYQLRSIQKFPAPAIPAELRETIAKDIVEQGISAAYPFASLSTGLLSEAAGIPYLKNQLVFVADDTLLGRFRSDFHDQLCMLEEREPSYVKKTDNTEEVALKLLEDNDDHINQKAVLKARVFDMYIMDFDRHEDQWRWYTTDTGRGKIYNPIPKDRDQAFFTNQGLFPTFFKRGSIIPDIQGFRPKAYNIKTFNKSARNFDRSFLTELNQKDWETITDEFLSKMTDDVIEKSLRLQPPEIQKYSASEIIRILKERRKYLMGDVLTYYRFISKIVNVTGTNQYELFTITRNNDGSVHVVVNKTSKEGVISSTIYDRAFDPSVTDEIRIYGMGGDDKFVFLGQNNKIKIRIIGGPGVDEFQSNGSSRKTIVYDADFENEKNKFTGNNNYRKKISADPTVNRYDRLYYKYNKFTYGLVPAYNVDNGVSLGVRVSYEGHGFQKEPYKMRHDLYVTHALGAQSYYIRYNAEFIRALGHYDLLIRSDFKAPVNVKNFFGLGNGTVYDKTKPGKIKYYRSRYNLSDISLLVRKNLQSWFIVSFGPTFQYYSLDTSVNKGRFINNYSLNGLDANHIEKTKTYLGLAFNAELNNRKEVLATRGTILKISARPMWGLNKAANNFLSMNADLSFLADFGPDVKYVVGNRVGYGLNIGHYEFFQAHYLGGDENLRGFRNNRFAGRSKFFYNLEFRYKFNDIKTYLFPGAYGLVAFYDVGRVWANGLDAKKWHSGYGGGLWIAPLKRFVLVGYYTFSKEGALPLVTLGFQF